jgi:class 3 adenylate cyclase
MRANVRVTRPLGEVRFLAFLNRFVTDLSLAILEGGGEIHKYVGDEGAVTFSKRRREGELMRGAGDDLSPCAHRRRAEHAV